MIDIILVHTGTVFESYINDCITQLKKFNLKIHLILSDCLFDKVEHKDVTLVKAEDYLDDYYNNFNLLGHDNSFRDGFWIRTSTRFFLINSYVKKNELSSFFHIENDNLLFTELDKIGEFLESQPYDMAVVIDSEQRCIPSIVWFRDSKITQILSEHIFLNNSVNDMTNLYNFFLLNRNIVTNLPIVPSNIDQTQFISSSGIRYSGNINYSNFYDDIGFIFDGAAIGQYLAGIDNRNNQNTIGFVNETTIFNVSKFEFKWILDSPVIIENGKKIKISNLHIHSKNLKLINIKKISNIK